MQGEFSTVDAMTATVESEDRAEVSALLSRYYRAVDDKRVDRTLVEETFAADGRWVSPTGLARIGFEAITAQQIEAIALFRATHHMTTDHIIRIEGDSARLQANVTAMHLWASGTGDEAALESHFLAGGVFDGHAVRTSAGWRFSELALRIVWRTGALPIHISPEKV
ncbi:nuclear transport factor 2 family protein [Nocardia sp. NPDC050793]|uniref:nuclear transport factor 2 family protein n=1 Tax=Nocardia sp. NPDC050793 TaxID=3155159 RepID=UPI0033DBBC49